MVELSIMVANITINIMYLTQNHKKNNIKKIGAEVFYLPRGANGLVALVMVVVALEALLVTGGPG